MEKAVNHIAREKRILELRIARTELIERVDITFNQKLPELKSLTDKIINLMKR